ncbi:Fe2OG dioxygenase domain-containing protein [Chloropicon primus]|uniref:Fe2OG dioxygenase domain-containing protein n=2 Tax=Chloropicon primus TaxID=1764295 RepID=A0A5B8MST1_9CHLO|nr:hypothetical protein A3770_07p49500 [Chloropicon primus]UPR01650.1 Fe2OG dioxygenase domain-containing protein [Chloropicon primus]|eukprot:QDZ22432.1 hypothetical protein A3770_07p49500 [Chloropicon primus]
MEWDERRVLPTRFGVRGEGRGLNTLEEVESSFRERVHVEEDSPAARRKRLLNDASLKRKVLVLEGFWTRKMCNDVLMCLREEMTGLGIGWHTKRHSAYSTVDLPLLEVPKLDSKLRRVLWRTLLSELAARFGFLSESDLFFKDLFFVKYEAGEGGDGKQAGLELHRDGSILSFNILLNPETGFEGGGTYFKHTDRTVEISQGDCVVHSGTVLHAGRKITKGKRFILVGFVEANPSVVPYHVRNLFAHPWEQVVELEARATAKREAENGGREGAQLDVEEDALRMLCCL